MQVRVEQVIVVCKLRVYQMKACQPNIRKTGEAPVESWEAIRSAKAI